MKTHNAAKMKYERPDIDFGDLSRVATTAFELIALLKTIPGETRLFVRPSGNQSTESHIFSDSGKLSVHKLNGQLYFCIDNTFHWYELRESSYDENGNTIPVT